ncbi:unnamed protein product, partial [Mesorhabditis spiculigera]
MEFNPSNLTTEREGATVTLSQAHLAYDTALWDYQYEEMVMAVILKRLPGLRVIEEQAVLGLWTEKDEIRHANEKPMTAPPSKVPDGDCKPVVGALRRENCSSARAPGKEEVEDIYKDYTSDQLKKVVDEYFEKTERELKKKLDDAAATMKAAQEAHSKELGRCYALAQYQMKEARALRRAYEDENGEGPNFSLDLPEVEDAVQWGSPFDLAVHTKPSLPPSPSSDDEVDEEGTTVSRRPSHADAPPQHRCSCSNANRRHHFS